MVDTRQTDMHLSEHELQNSRDSSSPAVHDNTSNGQRSNSCSELPIHNINTSSPLNGAQSQYPSHRPTHSWPNYSYPTQPRWGPYSPNAQAHLTVAVNTDDQRHMDTGATSHITDQADQGHTSDVEASTCRICFDDLSEGGETLLLECSCRGELALAHRECAIKWFSHKGDNTCEVCGHLIHNLPLDLLTISRTTTTANQDAEVGTNWGIFRVGQEAPELVFANASAYFLFFLNFLAVDIGDLSLFISILLACIVGTLAAMTSRTVARGLYLYAWLYSVVQLSFVAISTYTLRLEVIKLKNQPLLCVLSASLVGFVAAFCCWCIVAGSLKIRTWWLQQGANNN